jgi:ferredoxin--NADP+ reductase
MYRILVKEELNPVIDSYKIEAPQIARKAHAGQFVIIRVDEVGERIPLTLADWDAEQGTINLVVMKVGTSTYKLATLKQNDSILDLVGPLGLASEIKNFGKVICVGGGVGIAPIHPIARALKKAGNEVITIIGSRNKDLLFWEDKMRSVSDKLIVTTDDGSYGLKAQVTAPLKEILESNKDIKHIWAIGPVVMMKYCTLTSKPFNVPIVVSLNSIMVDGTGMCGCCRVSISEKTKFACVDGPEFDGYAVDWDLLSNRQLSYCDEEKQSLDQWLKTCNCKPN